MPNPRLIHACLTVTGDVDPDTAEGEQLLENIESELELGLAALIANLSEKFPNAGLEYRSSV